MALENFIPSVWAGSILQSLETALVYGQMGIVNRDYEGTITSGGDTVRINSIGDPTVGTYAKNQDISSPETLTDAQSMLLIDQTPYINFAVDDIDAAQQNPKVMAEAMQRAGYMLEKNVDAYMAGLHTQIANTSNQLGSDGTPKTVGIGGSDVNAYNLLVDLGVILDENDVPAQGRWVVVPPWYVGLLLKDDRFVRYGTPAQNELLRNGAPGTGLVGFTVDGLSVYKSNQVKNTTGAKYKIMAGHSMSWSLAVQLTKVEAYRPEKRFADAVKGLLLYGAKVVRPNQMALLTASKGTLS